MTPLVNLTAHPLLPEQIAAATANGWTPFEAWEVLSTGALEKLRQSPDDPEALRQLAITIDWELDFWREGEKYLHLPAGSPAFMAVLAVILAGHPTNHMVFSHSRRDSVEEIQPDGTVLKKAVFKFEKFIVL